MSKICLVASASLCVFSVSSSWVKLVAAMALAFVAPVGPGLRSPAAPVHAARTPTASLAPHLPVTFGLAAGAAFVAAKAATTRGPRRSRVARRGWGDDVTFYEASVASNVEAAEGLRLISVTVGEDVSKPYQRGGQFVQAKADDEAKPSFYAISSAPGSGDLEFLIKEAESNAWITESKAGDLVKLSPAMGKGFDLSCEAWKEGGVKQVNIFATGSGVAPMRAVIESDALKGKTCRLYYGARTEAGMAYADRFEEP
eukprot:s1487_g3.t1